jgi:NAD-dependent DNA ligase
MNSKQKEIYSGFRNHGTQFLDNLTPKPILDFILAANQAYTQGNPFLTDGEYDAIVDYAKKRKNLRTKINAIIGAPVGNDSRKTQLPYFMGSMNKIKPDQSTLENWKKEYKDPYCLSAKLDGVSGLYICNEGKQALYTRGNGVIGQDISNLIPYFQLPNHQNMVVRGEFIIPKSIFENQYKDEFSNARNLVAGLINSKYIEPEKYINIHFVSYEVIEPKMLPSTGFQYLKDNGFNVVKNTNVLMKQNLTNSFLSKILVMWRNTLPYEIDGVIVTSDYQYERKNENPKHSFAFKMILDDQKAETSVHDVIWTPSKDGYLKPRIRIEPVTIGGATIEYVTGFNGKYIQTNGIGPGAVIQLIRSGDVIPHIVGITQKVEPKMPTEDYIWNDTNIDILLKNKESNLTVMIKQYTLFFQRCGAKQIGEGVITRFVHNGYTTLDSILNLTKEQIVALEGFQEKSAMIIRQQFELCKNSSFLILCFASSILGRGFGLKKLKLIIEHYPDVFISNEPKESKIEKVENIPGFAHKTAVVFVEQIPNVIQWFKTMKLEHKLYENKSENVNINTNGKFKNKKICITGFRNKILEELIQKEGGTIQNSVNKSTNLLLIKSSDFTSSKTVKAKELNIPIMVVDEFIKTYSI